MIRTATVEDLPSLEACAAEFYASSEHLRKFDLNKFCQSWQHLLSTGIGVIFILERDGPIVGAIGGVKYPDIYSGELVGSEFFWFVRATHRGEGLKLYRCFERWARDSSCKQIRMIHLSDSMPEKLERVYRALGFVPVETHYAKEL